MIEVFLDDHTGKAVRYDRPEERDEALKLLWQGADPFGRYELSLDLPPGDLPGDPRPQRGYVGFKYDE